MNQRIKTEVLDRRRAGILMHPTSLPAGEKLGRLGADSFRFIDFLADIGATVWQMLPLGPTLEGLSPYQTLSVHAGNTELISLRRLFEWGWLPEEPVCEGHDTQWRRYHHEELCKARKGFMERASREDRKAYSEFVSRHFNWLENYVLYQSLKTHHQGAPWWEWEAPLRDCDSRALAAVQEELADELEQGRFEQFVFYHQWHQVKDYAHQRGVQLFGDMPIFVAHDSAEVWARRDLFDLDEFGHPRTVAGVPPDYFSETGQRWGNPQYDWDHMQADGFIWWKERLASQLELFDFIRIDHFRGFEAYWSIPAHEETAINGHWIKAPGEALFDSLKERYGELPFVAEDLGIITPEVDALRERYGLPGMKILQFAFGSGHENPYLCHNHEKNTVVYTGTHDNNTTLGWIESSTPELVNEIMDYLGKPTEPMPWPIIRTALASVAKLAVIPLQDVLALDGQHRMNTPGTSEGNWEWRFDWDWITDETRRRMSHLIELYGRK
jgi:4-alpha-glucanotransferase